MPKKINEELSSFGKRLAKLRKAAGYTQQQLADEISATRRMIAYYESRNEAYHVLGNTYQTTETGS